MTRDHASAAALGALLVLGLTPVFWPSGAAAHTCDDPFSTDLIVGQTKDAGDVKVCNDGTTLTITYEATYPFCLLETNLQVATSVGDIPQNRRGSPTPDQFADGDEYDPCVGTDTFEIPLDEIGEEGVSPGETVFVAARADLEDEDGRVEEAWVKAPPSSRAVGRCTSSTLSRRLPPRRASATAERAPTVRRGR